MIGWSDDELRATIRSYLTMAQLQLEGSKFSKKAFRDELLGGPLKGRSASSIEFRMRNISAVMEEHGQPILSGYLPAENVGKAVRAKLWSLIEQEQPKAPQEASSGNTKPQPSRPPMIYFNIGWMKNYSGMAEDDPTSGRHGYLAAHSHGHEAFNFLPTSDGRVEGHRPGRGRLNIARLGGGRGQPSIDGVLVIWLATEPVSGRALIVGWYSNATAYAKPREGAHAVVDGPWQYVVETRASDAHLVPDVARTFWVQSARTATDGGFGQSPTWYGNDTVNQRVWDYVRSVLKRSSAKPTPQRPPINLDPELRRKVEKAAVDRATAYYKSPEGGSCSVESVDTAVAGIWRCAAMGSNGWSKSKDCRAQIWSVS